MPDFQHRDCTLVYDDHPGPTERAPVLLLHGLGSSARDWEYQLPALLGHYRLLVPDLRGHGRSGKPRGGYSMAGFAEDCAAARPARLRSGTPGRHQHGRDDRLPVGLRPTRPAAQPDHRQQHSGSHPAQASRTSGGGQAQAPLAPAQPADHRPRPRPAVVSQGGTGRAAREDRGALGGERQARLPGQPRRDHRLGRAGTIGRDRLSDPGDQRGSRLHAGIAEAGLLRADRRRPPGGGGGLPPRHADGPTRSSPVPCWPPRLPPSRTS